MTLLTDLQRNTLFEKAVDYIKSINRTSSTHSNLGKPITISLIIEHPALI